MNKISLLIIAIFLIGSASAVLLSDQGTDVKSISDENLLESGNLTILVYNSSSGGNPIFNSTIQNAIVNGSWNLMINPGLQYGKSYWKDYEINGENLNFNGNDRIEFQSPLGLINDASFINFSLIQSCPEGNAIRIVNANGSVECLSVNSNATNLTNYALKNQSETFEGNITTTHTGFFGFLGSLANRITKLFVQNIEASENINASGNVTANYFKGSGEFLTNLPAGTESDPIWTANSTLVLYVADLPLENRTISHINNITGFLYNYNQTSPAIGYVDSQGFITSSIANATYLLITDLPLENRTVVHCSNITGSVSDLCTMVEGNSMNIFDQILNTTSNVTFESVNATKEIYIGNIAAKQWLYNQTTPANSYTDSVNASQSNWIINTFLSISNAISQYFNKTEIQSQYYNKTDIDDFEFVNSSELNSYNETELVLSINTTTNIMSLNFYNESEIDALIAGIETGGNSSFNQSLTDTLYAGIQWSYNQSAPVFTYINVNEASWLSTFNQTYHNNIANNSWNQSLADVLYASIIWAYNQTQPAIDYVNSQGFITEGIENNTAGWALNFTKIFSNDWTNITITESQIIDLAHTLDTNETIRFNNLVDNDCPAGKLIIGIQVNGTALCADDIAGGNSTFNQSLTDTLYISQSEEGNLNVNSSSYWNNLNATNSTQFSGNNGMLNILESWLVSFFNSLFGAKTTDELAEGTTNFYDNRSWNQSFADSSYISKEGDTITGNLDLSSNNVTSIDCITFSSGGKICSA